MEKQKSNKDRSLYAYVLEAVFLVLLVFIPLYPKLPLLDVAFTWTYIRVEDILVAIAYLVLAFGIIFNKTKIKNLLLVPIIIFWIIGFVSTLWAANTVGLTDNWAVFKPHLIFLHYFRRIEYLGVLFVAYCAMREGAKLKRVLFVLVAVLLGVSLYGFGQKFLGFCSYLTMNEEFAKGQCIALQPGTRISSTFGGHYDLAGFLVLIIPIVIALIMAAKKPLQKIVLILISLSGFLTLILTASRISFGAIFISFSILGFLIAKNKKILFAGFLVIMLLTLIFGRSTILDRFAKTIRIQQVTINQETGRVLEQPTKDKDWGGLPESDRAIILPFQTGEATDSAYKVTKYEKGSEPEMIQPGMIRKIFTIPDAELEENSNNKSREIIEEVEVIKGNFIRKTALVLDISFTTRLDGEWPKVIDAFLSHPLFGQGYSTVTAAVDSSFLRALGEVGLLGFLSFFYILILYLYKSYHFIVKTTYKARKMFMVGLFSGIVGLIFNALLIDIFEASKVAFVLWMLIGVGVWVIEQQTNENSENKDEL